ncbi:hypothetical protein Anapl_10442 [Anas platyrhynchos]|uniref:Uncharacterized protein n=1 Tax=Anas platyrhynchos TaxID=8839 RepID=R0LIU6_ANAPL|nr:hypothetical protein Anapl_10442 [Anas platyrhynchos]
MHQVRVHFRCADTSRSVCPPAAVPSQERIPDQARTFRATCLVHSRSHSHTKHPLSPESDISTGFATDQYLAGFMYPRSLFDIQAPRLLNPGLSRTPCDHTGGREHQQFSAFDLGLFSEWQLGADFG